MLFDHIVGALLELRRHLDTQRLRRLEIDDKLKIDRLLHRKFGGLLTFEYLVDIDRRAAKLIEIVRRVRQKAARVDIGPIRVDRGQSAGCRKIHKSPNGAQAGSDPPGRSWRQVLPWRS